MRNQILNQVTPLIVSVISTKGGVTKSTNVANIGAFCADHGIKTLMVDTDTQPTLSSYYHIANQSSFGIYELFNRTEWLLNLMILLLILYDVKDRH